MSEPKNIVQKIWETHIVKQNPGHPAILAIDLQLTHEVTSPQGFTMLRQKNLPVKLPYRNIATLDHSIPTRKDRQNIHDPIAKKQVETLRKNVKDFGIRIFDYDSGHQGIVHVIGPELGLTQPGMTIVCGDSHTSTHGAFGALAFGVGSTEVGLVLATGCILQQEPKVMKVTFDGEFKPGVFAKDAILKLISEIGVGGANGFVIEFCGLAIKNMSMEARMTICNMSIECGARAGLVNPDQKTFEWILGKNYENSSNQDSFREYSPEPKKAKEAVKYWQSFISDLGCKYQKEIYIDVSNLAPMITWGTNPSEGIQINQNIPTIETINQQNKNNFQKSLDYTNLKADQKMLDLPIDWVFIGSCTNSRLEDLKIAAKIFYPDFEGNKIQNLDPNKVQKIAKNVICYIVPGSEEVKKQGEEIGLDKIFRLAGCDWRMPGCSMCLGMNDDKIPAKKRCLSTSNRNFMHRQGPGSITHLCSPATAASSAIYGKIVDCREFFR
jgi:3-isopropylmalate/(R)-2-methylmalate dehydratase large subunit